MSPHVLHAELAEVEARLAPRLPARLKAAGLLESVRRDLLLADAARHRMRVAQAADDPQNVEDYGRLALAALRRAEIKLRVLRSA